MNNRAERLVVSHFVAKHVARKARSACGFKRAGEALQEFAALLDGLSIEDAEKARRITNPPFDPEAALAEVCAAYQLASVRMGTTANTDNNFDDANNGLTKAI